MTSDTLERGLEFLIVESLICDAGYEPGRPEAYAATMPWTSPSYWRSDKPRNLTNWPRWRSKPTVPSRPIFDAFPWTLVEKIGVIDQIVAQQVHGVIATGGHQPSVSIERGWYF